MKAMLPLAAILLFSANAHAASAMREHNPSQDKELIAQALESEYGRHYQQLHVEPEFAETGRSRVNVMMKVVKKILGDKVEVTENYLSYHVTYRKDGAPMECHAMVSDDKNRPESARVFVGACNKRLLEVSLFDKPEVLAYVPIRSNVTRRAAGTEAQPVAEAAEAAAPAAPQTRVAPETDLKPVEANGTL